MHDEADIRSAVAAYNVALNSGKTSMVLPLYEEDGIFMAPYSPSAIGNTAVQQAYDKVFKELTFHVTFNVAEVVQVSPTWAFVRTNSSGTTDHASGGTTLTEANQELFIFKKGEDSRWRIARYSFSPINPPKI
jgi:uncharacterized protein (TIGR02246 family)